MAYFTLTPAAKADYRELRAFLTEEAGPVTAAQILGELEAACQRIAELPMIGRERPEYDPDVRSIPFRDDHLIFYFPRPFGATIARVYHTARHPDDVL